MLFQEIAQLQVALLFQERMLQPFRLQASAICLKSGYTAMAVHWFRNV
jgi:hypothetical protein